MFYKTQKCSKVTSCERTISSRDLVRDYILELLFFQYFYFCNFDEIQMKFKKNIGNYQTSGD